MSSIDERVVEMKFQNGQFENGIKSTLNSLSALKDGLKLHGATKGLDDVSSAASKFSLAGMQESLSNISSKFSAMSVIAITALTNIANKAINVGTTLIKSLTTDQISSGLKEYETNLNSIQTILSNTSAKGTTLDQVNQALQDLNTYSDQTIYNFSEMARNIGTFTAAGVELKPATEAIKGIANLAAMSGSSSEQASTAMYQLSQAMSTGTVKLMDWNSVVNAGMGGQVFQDAIKETARNQGVAVDDIIKKNGSFRDSLQEGWLTSDILTKTLQKFTGDLNASQLKTMGYNDEQIAGILKMGQTAKDAATKIKTMSQLVNTLQETAGSGWAKTWQTIFGDFDEAKVLFTNVNNVLGGMINASADARNKVLSEWKDLGGRTAVINGISNAFNALMAVLAPVKEAFRDIFPPMTGARLAEMSKNFEEFTKKLKPGEETLSAIKTIFTGVFAVFSIGAQVIKGIASVFGRLFSSMTEGSSGILHFLSGIALWITGVDKAIKSGVGFTRFFDQIGDVVVGAVGYIKDFAKAIGSMFTGDTIKNMGGGVFERFAERFAPLKTLAEAAAKAWGAFLGNIQGVLNFLRPFGDAVSAAFSQLGTAIASSIKTGDFNTVLDTINTGLFAGLVLLIKKFVNGGLKVDFGDGMLDSVKKSLDGLTGSLKAMETSIKADAILKIAGAVGILTVSVVALSLIDSAKLTKALVAITVMFTQLGAALAIFDKISSSGAALKLPFVAAGLILLGGAILILSAAVKNLSDIPWGDLIKGLTGVVVLLGAVVATMQLMPKDTGKMISAGIGMIAIAAAIKILASAVKDFGEMDTGTLVKGLASVGAALTALAIFTRLGELGKSSLSSGAGLVLLGVSLKIIASAVQDFGGMDWETLGKGFGSMAVSLGLIVAALALMPPNTLMSAVALGVVAGSLLLIGEALKKMGGMSWEEIAKGLITLAASLGIIAVAMILMTEALPGAAALLVVAASLAILAPVLKTMGGMSWEEIGKGMLVLAGALAILAIAAALMTPLIPSLLGLGVAIGLLGLGLALAGAGVLMFSTGLTALSIAGTAGAAALTAIFGAVINLIPMALKAVGEGIILFAKVISESGPTMTAAATTMITSILIAIQVNAPRIIATLASMVIQLVQTLANNVPKFVDAGMKIIVGILNGIANNIYQVVTAGTRVVTEFIRGVGDNAGKVAEEGARTVVKFVNGVADAIRNNSGALQAAGRNVGSAIIDGLTGGISGGIGSVIQAAKNVAQTALNAAKSLLGIASPSKEFHQIGKFVDQGFALGLDAYSGIVAKSSADVGQTAIDSMKKSIVGMNEIVAANMDVNPTITPVLDLTNVQRDATKLGSLLQTKPFTVGTTLTSATAASNGYSGNQQVATETSSDRSISSPITFVQNNNSPKALSTAEIYRQTKNQLSVAKGG
jgi:tape measure domain-containing protein